MKDDGILTFNESSLKAVLQKILPWLAVGLGIVFFITAVIGAIQNFSPVPFWDMWPGYLEFYMRTLNGDAAAWWAQHNEHRIVLSRLLFWIDFRYFNGTTWFLILANYLLAFAIWITLCTISRFVLSGDKLKASRTIYAGVSLALIFSWIQKDNLTWAFQSQMFAGMLLPMLAFLFFYRAEITTGRESTLYFICSLVVGVLASGTMMNGLAVLPIMMVLGMLLRVSKEKVVLVVALAIAICILYIRGATRSSSFFHSLLEQPLAVLKFFLVYVGAPAHYIFRDGISTSMFAGSIIVIGLVVNIIYILIKPNENRGIYVILAILVYGTLSGFGVAGSRIVWGVESAITSRYMTSVLVIWSAVILLLLFYFSKWKRGHVVISLLALIIPASLVSVQLKAVAQDRVVLTDRLFSVLALELGIRDDEQIRKIFPWNDRGPDYPWLNWALSIAKTTTEKDLSIFGNSLIRDAEKSLGTFNRHHGIECIGGVEAVNKISGETRFDRLSLWLMDPYSGRTPGAFYVLNAERKVIGYGVSGYPRYGLGDSSEVHNAGASAYLLSNELTESVILKGRDMNCEVTVSMPLFSSSLAKLPVDRGTVSSTNVLPGNQWMGADFARSVIEGMQVHGSFIKADADVGTFSVRMKRGDRIFYRSGPTGGHQFLEVLGSGAPPIKLPVSMEWSVLEFSSRFLPEGSFVAKFSDEGAGFGEWSAVAVLRNNQ